MKHTVLSKLRYLVPVLLFPFWFQIGLAESVRVTNVRFEMNDSVVTILYDVFSDMKIKAIAIEDMDESNIIAVLRKESDPYFSYPITYASGDIGKGRWTGKNKKIVWNIQKEFPYGIDGTDYYFEIRLEPIANEINSTYMWIGIGTTVAVGGLVTYFITTGNTNEEKAGGFPMPPGRPK